MQYSIAAGAIFELFIHCLFSLQLEVSNPPECPQGGGPNRAPIAQWVGVPTPLTHTMQGEEHGNSLLIASKLLTYGIAAIILSPQTGSPITGGE